MFKNLIAFAAGVGTAIVIASFSRARGLAAATGLTTLDLNTASVEDLVALGLDSLMAYRVLENRPYRTKFDLVDRYVLGRVDYDLIKDKIAVNLSNDNGIKVAS